ncbi:cell wall protein IFF6 isoform X1 [Megalobrama amblycephala]|uniref:cell wall protein IFF6 isoform X1 n=1 Tax=Megalobrama amblycephala TaxID=75352 RepID=UPI0020142534|nr:cell wall protein IFF6 isoform X1 [Megalobrama amblycephala]
MEMTLLSITVWFTHFLIASALYFNTLPTNTTSDHTETTQVTPATTKTNHEPKILINATSFSPPTTTQDSTINMPSEVHTQPNTTPYVTPTEETTSLHQYNSSTSSQNDTMDDGVGNSSNVAVSHRNTSHATVSTDFARLTPQNIETETMSSMSYNDGGRPVQTADTLSDPLNSVSTVPWTEKEDDRTKADEGNYETNSTQATFANTKEESRGTQSTEGSEHREEPNDTAANTIGVSAATATARIDWSTSQNLDIPMNTTAQNSTVTDAPEYHTSIDGVSATIHDWSTSQISDIPMNTTAQDPTVTDVPEHHTSIDGVSATIHDWSTSQISDIPMNTTAQDPTVTDVPEHHTSIGGVSAATTTARIHDWSTSQISDIPMNTTAQDPTVTDVPEHHTSIDGVSATIHDWSTSQISDIPMNTTAQDPTVTDAPEHHTSIGGVNHSTIQQNRFTNSTAHTGRENITGTDTPGGTTTYNNNNNSIITDVLTDATTNETNKTDTESNVWPKCLNPESKSRQSRLVCFITVWALAMTATIFLGITIFLWVRLTVFKKKMKRREKGGQKGEKESLWADPKASVQERVEFWYVNGSTMEADRKQKDRKRQERMKKRGQQLDTEENGLWIQPRVTVDDITEFWYANRRLKEDRMQDM